MIFGNGDDVALCAHPAPISLAPSASYLRTVECMLPSVPGTYWIFVQADTDGAINEDQFEGNNSAIASNPLDVLLIPRPDLTVSIDPIALTSLESSQPVSITFRVTNTGVGSTTALVWRDDIHFTNDPGTLNSGTRRGRFNNLAFLLPGESYVRNALVTLPPDFSGSGYQFVVVTDAVGEQIESSESNNYAQSTTFVVTLEPQPDLRTQNVRTPFELAFTGQTLEVTWLDENIGAPWPRRHLPSGSKTLGSASGDCPSFARSSASFRARPPSTASPARLRTGLRAVACGRALAYLFMGRELGRGRPGTRC